MARGRRTVSRMEKMGSQGLVQVAANGNHILTWQLDSGEVEAQIKRIMLSFGESGAKKSTFRLGLFQKQPTTLADFDDETIVITGAIGNQFVHNETITARLPKDWWIGMIMVNFDGANDSFLTYSLQLNYKVLN